MLRPAPAPELLQALGMALAEDHHTAAIAVTRDGTVRFANPCARRVAGAADALREGAALQRVILDEDQAALARLLTAVEAHGPELLRFADDGLPVGIRALVVTGTPLGGAGDDVALVGRDAGLELTREGRIRTAERFELVGQLASGLAHELNNALSAVTTYSDLLLAGAVPGSEAAADLGEIKQGAVDAAALIRKLDLFAGASVKEPEPVFVPDVVHGMKKLLGRFLTRDVALTVEADDTTPPVLATPLALEEVLVALVANARDALAGKGSVTINVRTGGTPVAPTAVLEVVDTGTGPRPPEAGRAVEAFFSTKPLGEGTGLGLAVVERIVRALGGTFRIQPRPGGGAVASVELPGSLEASVDEEGY